MRRDDIAQQIAWIEFLEQVQQSGVEAATVSHGGRTITYHSIGMLERLVEKERGVLNQMRYPEQGRATRSLADFR